MTQEEPAAEGTRICCEHTPTGWQVRLLRGETALSWCSVVDRTLRFGAAALHVGGIGGVGTLTTERRRGHARRVLETAVELMGREGYDISFLHGIQDFYGRFGYVTCMPEYELWLHTRDAERARSPLRTRRLGPGDTAAVVALYDRDNADRRGSAVRDAASWPGFARGTWWTLRADVQVVTDAADCLVGYVAVDATDEACRVSEAGGQGRAVYDAILQYLARRAVRLRRERIALHLPDDHALAVYARRYGLHSATLYPRAEKGMGRIIALDATMAKLTTELARRWPVDCRNTRLSLQTDLGQGQLCWHAGQVQWLSGSAAAAADAPAVTLDQQTLTQLLYGYVSAAALASWDGLALPPAAAQLFLALFPPALPQLWWADRF